MNQWEETMLLALFKTEEQHRIVSKISESYNTSHVAGIKAALYDAALLGFCAGLESANKLNKE